MQGGGRGTEERGTFRLGIVVLLLGDVQVGDVSGVMLLVVKLHDFTGDDGLERIVIVWKIGQRVF